LYTPNELTVALPGPQIGGRECVFGSKVGAWKGQLKSWHNGNIYSLQNIARVGAGKYVALLRLIPYLCRIELEGISGEILCSRLKSNITERESRYQH